MPDDIRWREVTMAEAVEFMRTRRLKDDSTAHDFDKMTSTVEFEDGSKVRCESRWRGPYSETTPDIDGEPPSFFVFEPTPPAN